MISTFTKTNYPEKAGYNVSNANAPAKGDKSFWIYALLSCFFSALFVSSNSYSQDYNCTSNDVRIVRAYLTTTVGGEISCADDDPITATLHLVVSTKTPRKGVFISADLFIKGTKHSTIANCFEDDLNGANNDLSVDISIPCPIGKTVELKNVFTAWGTGNDQFCPSTTPATPSKCRYKSGEVIVVELLGSGFTFVQGACTGNDRSIELTGNASGGTAPYTYEWFTDYGKPEEVKFSTTAGTHSQTDVVTKSFESGKDYSVTLKVTDNEGVEKLTTHTVPVISCCMLEVACPNSTDLGSFTCSNVNTLPATTGTVENLASWYNIQLGTNPCGTIKWSASDNATPNTCSTSDQSITRTVTVWDDLNGDGIYDEGDEESATCTFTYTVVADKTGPELNGTLPGSSGIDACMADAPSAPGVGTIAALYSDNCSGVTATLTTSLFAQGSTNCSWTKTYTYSVKDACLNETIAVVTFSGGDNTAPTITCPSAKTIQCGESLDPNVNTALGKATATDNCGTPTISYSDGAPSACNSDGSYTITRTWKAEDGCGKVSECTQIITVTTKKKVDCWSIQLKNMIVAGGNTTFTYQVCGDKCAWALSYIAFKVKDKSITVLNPTNGSYYPSASNPKYKVLVPISKNVYGIKYEVAMGEGIKTTCDDFTFTLKGTPAQIGTINVEIKYGTKTTLIPVTPGTSCLCANSTLSTARVMSAATTSTSSDLAVTTSPNPYNDKIRFFVTNPVAGRGSLEVYNMIGQRLKIVHQGHIPAGIQAYDLNVPSAIRSSLIYVLRVGNKQITGKIMYVGEGRTQK